jgi:hypothetical protein
MQQGGGGRSDATPALASHTLDMGRYTVCWFLSTPPHVNTHTRWRHSSSILTQHTSTLPVNKRQTIVLNRAPRVCSISCRPTPTDRHAQPRAVQFAILRGPVQQPGCSCCRWCDAVRSATFQLQCGVNTSYPSVSGTAPQLNHHRPSPPLLLV